MSEPNIVLTGFMGTGKTSVGREVAARLGRPFVDLDEMIVQAAGKTIAAIFEEEGEASFRRLEAEACRHLATPAGIVVATGGGAVLDPRNQEALQAGGIVICLEAEIEAILERLGTNDERPLLAGTDRRARVEGLLASRSGVYAALPHHLDTSRLTARAAAEQVIALACGLPQGAHALPIGLSADRGLQASARPAGYQVLIADGLLSQAGSRLREAGLTAGRCAVVTNSVVGRHYARPLVDSLEAAGLEPAVLEAPDGEQYKTLTTAGMLYARLASTRLARKEPIIALGGGVIGDLAGFVAATWLRGVPFVQIPTSLLAMVDASVGGKVGVDLPEGKNLVGAFKQPVLVLTDPSLTETLPDEEFRCGLAEIIKCGVIADPALFGLLEAGASRRALRPQLTGIIAGAVRVKADIVERDPYEEGDRAWLNLGHTFGHALELLSGYTLRHGEAVGLGMIAAAALGVELGLCDSALLHRIRGAIAAHDLPVQIAFDPARALAAMATDKKRRGRGLRFVVPAQIGRVVMVDGAPEEAIRRALSAIRG